MRVIPQGGGRRQVPRSPPLKHTTGYHDTSLGHQRRGVFCGDPIFLNYIQQIFPGGVKNFLGGFSPLASPIATSRHETGLFAS